MMIRPVGNFKRIFTIRYSSKSTRTVLKPISSSRAPFPTRPSPAPPRRYRQRRIHPPPYCWYRSRRDPFIAGTRRFAILGSAKRASTTPSAGLDIGAKKQPTSGSSIVHSIQAAQRIRVLQPTHRSPSKPAETKITRCSGTPSIGITGCWRGICDTCGADTAKEHMHRIK